MSDQAGLAPALVAERWLNSPPLSLQGLRGRVVALHFFQMLCPGCVAHGLPQAAAMRRAFAEHELAVIGVHSVFEHHDVMTPRALEAFVHEYGITYPVAVDMPDAQHRVPRTLRAYALRGTPSLVLLDKAGRVRLHHFGRLDDLQAGAAVGRLLAEPASPEPMRCDDGGCRIDAPDTGPPPA